MRLALVLVLLATAVAAPFTVAEAGGSRRVEHVVPDRAFSGPGARFRDVDNFREQFRQQRERGVVGPQVVVVPQVVFVSPGRCWQAGYWNYQWVPQSYAYNAWVPAQWSPDGHWIEGHYEAAWYNGGSYQPYWVEGYWARC